MDIISEIMKKRTRVEEKDRRDYKSSLRLFQKQEMNGYVLVRYWY